MLAVVQAFAVIGVVVAVGMLAGRTGALGDNARIVLNRCAFYVGLPALLLLTLADSTPGEVFSQVLLVSVLAVVVVAALYLAVTMGVLRRSRGDAVIGAQLASVANVGNLGIPLSAYVFGRTTEVSAVLVFQFVVLVPLTLAVLDSEGAERLSLGRRAVRVIATPMVAAGAIGISLAFADLELPGAIRDPLELLGALAVPTVLLAFGISLGSPGERPSRAPRDELAIAVVLKAFVMPAVAYAMARWWFDADPEQLLLVTVLAALPSAQNINTFATVYQRAEGLARDGTLYTTVLSVPVIIGIVALLG